MAEIIWPDFNSRRIIKREDTGDEKPPEKIKAPDNFVIGRDMNEYLEASLAGTDLGPLMKLVYEITEFQIWQAGFTDYSDRELIDMFAKSGLEDWQVKPAYYRALYKVIEERIKEKEF